MQYLIKIVLAILIGFSLGCASKGFNRGELSNQIGTVKPVFDDEQIKQAFNKKANLPRKFKLGIYFKSPKPINYYRGVQWRWTEQDKNFFDDISNNLKSEGIISDSFPILDLDQNGESFDQLRMTAAQYQADAILIIEGVADIDRYINHWGWSYAFLLPTFFIPGSEADSIFIASAALWDVKNQYLYLTAQTESTSNETYVAAFGKQDKELIEIVKSQALDKLKLEIQKMIKG